MAAAPVPSNNGHGALSLRGWMAEAEAAAWIAKSLAPTAFVPDHLKVWQNPRERDPEKRILDFDTTVQQVAAVLLAGQELELQPMAALRAFVIIRGQVALYAIAARALLQHHGHEIVVVESTSTRAIVRGRRFGSDQWQEVTWDLDRAKTAGLYPGHPDGNWRKQPKAMMVARATAEVARWVASDAMLGLPLIAEEIQDTDWDGELAQLTGPQAPAEPASTQPPPGGKPREVRRKTSARTPLPALPPPPPAAAPPAPVPEPARSRPKPSKPQLAKLHAGLTAIQVTGRTEGLALISAWVGRQVESTSDLEPDELQTVLERLDSLRSIAQQDPGPPEPEAEEGPPDAEPDEE